MLIFSSFAFSDDDNDAIDVRDQLDFEVMVRLYNVEALMIVIEEWPAENLLN